MNFIQKLKSVVAKLGLSDKAKDKQLTAEDNQQIAASYKDTFGVDLEADAQAYDATVAKAAAYDKIIQGISFEPEGSADNTGTGTGDATEHETSSPDANASAVINSVNSLNETMRALASRAQGDTPENVIRSADVAVLGTAHTATHLYGIENPFFAFDKRWNQIAKSGRAAEEDASKSDKKAFYEEFDKFGESLNARYRQLKILGLITNNKLGTVDYSSLNDAELGTRFIVRRQDALIARIVALPSLNDIFGLRSNIQDGEVITNAFFDEFSRAYAEGEISKGGFKLEPEKAHVDDVMFKYLIPSFKWIEKSYLGYLNTSGSDPVKWSMIEWLILEIAKKLQNERNQRAIQGYRVEPKEGASTHANFSTTGLIHRVVSFVEDNRVLPFKGADYIYASATDIGDILQSFAAQLAEIVENPLDYVLYLNAKHKAWYKAWYTKEFGSNANFDGVNMTVPNYENRIVWVPNMGNSKFIIATQEGNLNQLENIPGEMSKISFEQHLESVWAWSVWKEGFAAGFSGKKFETVAELEAAGGAEQIIFINWPAKELAADVTTINVAPTELSDGMLITAANTKATAITDLTGAKKGVIYRIECGATQNPTSIAKSGKFDGLTADWTPEKKGEFIKVYYHNDKFIEVARG